jgi:hypothetical protein
VFELARELISARKKAGLMKGDVAARMGTIKAWWHASNVARGRHPCE